jgi:crotonobetainyl-CoA:carnitine CoA-transferase CaiB-like acyl-CoA transferase
MHQCGPFVRISGVTPGSGLRAPVLGEHTREVLRDLDYDETEIQQLVDEGTVYAH